MLGIPKYSAFSDARLVCPNYMDMVKLLARSTSRKSSPLNSDIANIFVTLIVLKKNIL